MNGQMHIEGNIPGAGRARVQIDGASIGAVEILGKEDPGIPILSPGWTDLQVNGLGGVDFSDPNLRPEQISKILPLFWRTGVTSFCPTLITSPRNTLLRNFRLLEDVRGSNPEFAASAPCYHLEGPYLSPLGSRGAHNQDHMHPPDWGEFSELQEAANGNIGIVTLAPELPGACAFIEKAVAAGVIVAIGHTDGGADHIRAAVKAGASLSTHLGNGCPKLIERHENPLWAQLAADELGATIICDGFHLPADFVKTVLKAKGIERTILITDAVHVTHLPPGRYEMAGVPVELQPAGKVVRVGDTCFAGSTLTMDRAIRQFMRFTGAGLEQALKAAGRNPAMLLKRKTVCAGLEPGRPANIVSFRPGPETLTVESTWLAGRRVFKTTRTKGVLPQ